MSHRYKSLEEFFRVHETNYVDNVIVEIEMEAILTGKPVEEVAQYYWDRLQAGR